MSVLVVDDEKISRETSAQQLRGAGYSARVAADAASAVALLERISVDVVLTDLRMPGGDGLALLDQINQRFPTIDVLIMTAYGTVETAVAAMHAGAADYLTKPFRFSELELRLRRLGELRDSRLELARLRALVGEAKVGGIIGRSPGMRAAIDRAVLFAEHAAPVLITGETGTGKEIVARAIHSVGRSQRSFVAVACGAIPDGLADSQLFGHEKGAFTGALQRRRGCFERAHGGTLLLDDVDDLPLDIQVKLLRVLQDGTLFRVGGEEQISVDVRVVATSKVDLADAVADRRFRDDLYYRLRGLEIHLPPLRTRGDDVLMLAHHFLAAHAITEETLVKTLSPEAANTLLRHGWPGNVRELRRVIEAATVLCPGDVIGAEHLPEALGATALSSPLQLHLDGVDRLDLPALVGELEESLIAWAMAQAGGNQSRAAELLGLPRTSLQTRLKRRSGN